MRFSSGRGVRDTGGLGREPNSPSSAAAHSGGESRPADARRRIEEEFRASGNAVALQRSLTRAADDAVREAYRSAVAPVLSPPAALIAAGDFGRGDLFPYSDLDILIVVENSAPALDLRNALSRFVALLRDQGWRPNQRVLTAEECITPREQNLRQTINFLDRRYLEAASGMEERIEEPLAAFFHEHGRQLGQTLAERARERHREYRNTPFHAEPDVRNAPGGLRDHLLIGRLAKLSETTAPPSEEARKAGEYVASVRCFLHYRAGDNRDVLDRAAQQALAEHPFAPSGLPASRGYYRSARVIFNEARAAMEALDGRGFDERDPGALLRLVESVAREGFEPPAEAERQLSRVGPLWPVLENIFRMRHAEAAVRMLHRAGVLGSIFPEWARIEGETSPELRYTLDEHSVMAVERLCRLRETGEGVQPRFAELLSEIEQRPALLFAVLFHHVGKVADLPWTGEEQSAIQFLSEHQHDLSDAVSGRDLHDPATAQWMASRAGTIERLKLLAMMTYADIAASEEEPTAAWRLDQLWSTYEVVRRELTRELKTERIQELPANLAAAHAEFIRGFPARYLRAHPASEVEQHGRLYEASRATGVALEIEPAGGAYRLTVIARDIPFLFASFAGALSSFGLDIVKAEAFSNAEGVVLDTFVFADPNRTLELNPPELERLEDLIRRVAVGKTDAQRLLRKQAKPEGSRAMKPRVRFDSETCESATLVEIVTEDRRGLLYSLASVFSSNACNIDVVLIDTKGRRAIDVFYVSRKGKKLQPELQSKIKEKLLAAC